jgi:hypothetical protein
MHETPWLRCSGAGDARGPDADRSDACRPDADRSDAYRWDVVGPGENSRGAADGVDGASAGRVTSGDVSSKYVASRRVTSGNGRHERATDRRHALARASAAHRRLTVVCAEHRALMPLVGGLLADTRRLLAALLRIAHPEAAFTPAASARPQAGRPAER